MLVHHFIYMDELLCKHVMFLKNKSFSSKFCVIHRSLSTISLLFCVHCSVCILFFRLLCSLSTSNVCVFMCQSDPLNLLERLFLWPLNIHPQGSSSLQRSDFKNPHAIPFHRRSLNPPFVSFLIKHWNVCLPFCIFCFSMFNCWHSSSLSIKVHSCCFLLEKI